MGINIVAKSMEMHEFIVKYLSGAKLVGKHVYSYITSQ